MSGFSGARSHQAGLALCERDGCFPFQNHSTLSQYVDAVLGLEVDHDIMTYFAVIVVACKGPGKKHEGDKEVLLSA